MSAEELMTKKEVAALMRVDPSTVQRWIARGRIHYVRVGHTLRISRRELLGALERFEFGDDRAPHDPALG